MAEAVIRPMAIADIDSVAELARRIWNAHYPEIISGDQIEYMLAQRYGRACLQAELADPAIAWMLAMVDGVIAGFSSTIVRKDGGVVELKLDKLYVAPELQRAGIGGALIRHAADRARSIGATTLILAVNKRNDKAVAAYRKHGFSMRDAVCVDIGNGFVMDDFIMQRTV